MSQVDFSQDALDNASLYIAVLPIGEVTASLYSSVLSTLNSLAAYRPPDGKNNLLHFKFLNAVPKWGHGNTEWSQFTPHKQIFGVLAVAQCFDEEEALLVEYEFKQGTAKYKHTLCDSKCIVFGNKKKLEEHLDFRRGFNLIEANLASNNIAADVIAAKKEIAVILGDFFLAIHGVLMSKLKEIINNYLGSNNKDIPQFISPFERTNDADKSYSRKHWMARVRKHVADTYLVAGCVQAAISQYTSVVESLRSHNDWLWLGSAYEGLSCAAIAMKMNEPLLQGEFINGLNWRNSPRMSHRLLNNHSSKTTLSGRSSPAIPIKRPNHVDSDDKCGEFGASIEEPVNVNEQEEEMFEEGTQNGYDEAEEEAEENEAEQEDCTDSFMQRFLQRDFVVDKFTRALHYYGKAGAIAGVSHIEALLKFTKFLVLEKRYPLASETLWRVFKVESYVSEEEKVLLYKTLAGVYTMMGFRRKAAMMIHYAALQSFKLCRNYSHPQALYQAYELLKDCLPGFSLSLDADDGDDNAVDENSISATDNHQPLLKGWPVIQARVLKDLVLVTKYMKQNASAVRLMCVLLQSLHMHLSSPELEEITSLLEQSATESQENQNIVPFVPEKKLNQPVPLTDIPKVRSFKPLDLPDNLYPHRYPGYKKRESIVDSGPFIFSSLRLHKKKKSKEVYWVEGSAVEVSIIIMNPLPFDIKVENMCILSEGVTMETIPFGLVLSPDYEPHPLTLISIPRGTGQLKLKGYSAKVFSVESKCIVNIVDHPIINVIPALPLVRIRLLAPASIKSFNLSVGAKHRDSVVSIVESSNMLEMMDGESSKLELVIENNGDKQAVTTAKIKFTSKDSDLCTMSFDEGELHSSLPLEAGQAAKLSVKVDASMLASFKVVVEEGRVNSPDGGNFFPGLIQPIADSPDMGDNTKSSSSFKYDEKTKTLPGTSRKTAKSPRMFVLRPKDTSDSQLKPRKKPTTTDDVDLYFYKKAQARRAISANVTRYGSPQSDNRLSIISNSSSIDSLVLEADNQPQTLPVYKSASAEFELEYTGGPGATEGYYRKSKISITIRILPVFHFSQFDVLPCSKIADKFVLSFNVANVTGSPVDLRCAVYQSPLNGLSSDVVSQTHCWSIGGSCSKRVTLELKKFILNEDRDASQQDKVVEYSDYLANMVNLMWNCPSLGKESSKSISAFAIPPEMLRIMKHVPIQLGVTMNDTDISTGQCGPRRYPVNSKITLSIAVNSVHSSTLTNLLLMVEPYQEKRGGSHDIDLHGKLVYSGSLRVKVPPLRSQQSYQYNMLLMFICKGTYHIGIKCSQQPATPHNLQPSRHSRDLTDSSKDISEKGQLLDPGKQDTRTNRLVSVSPVLPSSLHSRSPLPSLHSPTPVYDLYSPPPSPQVCALQDTLVGPLMTLEIY